MSLVKINRLVLSFLEILDIIINRRKIGVYQIRPNLATCSYFESATPQGWVIVDVRDLNDNEENTVDEVLNKIQLVGNLLCSGYKVVVRCQAGISRSNTIACAALLWTSPDRNWTQCWNEVKKHCPRAMLNPYFFDVVKKALRKLCVEKKRI